MVIYILKIKSIIYVSIHYSSNYCYRNVILFIWFKINLTITSIVKYLIKIYISFSDYYENSNRHIIRATFKNENIYTLINVYNMYVKEKNILITA